MYSQEQLTYVTELEAKRLNCKKIRGIRAYWRDETACIFFYFQGKFCENDVDMASEMCTYIISHFSDGLLEENFVRWDYPKPLPNDFLAYKRPENF